MPMPLLPKSKGDILFYTRSIPCSEDLIWHEEQILSLLPIGSSLKDSVQSACGHFDRMLQCVFESLANALAIEADHSLPSERVVRALDRQTPAGYFARYE